MRFKYMWRIENTMSLFKQRLCAYVRKNVKFVVGDCLKHSKIKKISFVVCGMCHKFPKRFYFD